MRLAMLKSMCCCVVLSACANAAELRTEQAPWPQLPPCKACLTIEFDVLHMQVPRDFISKIAVVNGDSANLFIVQSGFGDADGLNFLVREPEKITTAFNTTKGPFAGFFERLRIVTNEDFFDRLGEPLPEDRALAAIRKNFGLEEAVRYTKTERETVAAYWIHGKQPNEQTIFIVIDGYERVIELGGRMTDELFKELLARLTVVF